MTPQQKADQLAFRQRQYEGAKSAAARQGLDSNKVVPPRYGEANYDPFSRINGTGNRSAQNTEQAVAAEGDLRGRLQSVRNEKERVKRQLEKAQR
jgi:hypothetical protein